MESQKLKQVINSLPETPGVYFWRDDNGKPLYIGKAVNIRSRILSHFRTTDSRLLKMIEQTNKITYRLTDSEIEALILESQLIKKYKPAFNIMWRDDKRYFYVGFTTGDCPQIFITHQPTGVLRDSYSVSRKNRHTLYTIHNTDSFVGPFTDGTSLKTVLRSLRKIFPYCTCKQKHNVRCLNAHIGRCPGYCCLKNPQLTTNDKQQYKRNIKAIKDILSGRRKKLVGKLAHAHPDIALKILRVFHNAKINTKTDIVTRNTSYFIHNTPQPSRIEGYDIANISGRHTAGAMVVFENGAPNKNEYRLFNIKTSGGDTDMLKEMLERRLKNDWPRPKIVVIDGGIAQLNTAIAVFSKLKVKSEKLKIIALTKNERHQGVKIQFYDSKTYKLTTITLSRLPESERNLILAVDAEAHRFAISHYRRLHRKTVK